MHVDNVQKSPQNDDDYGGGGRSLNMPMVYSELLIKSHVLIVMDRIVNVMY